MFIFAIGLAGLLYLGMTAQPTSTVVLLPDTDGKAGRVELQTQAARQTLDAPYASANATNRGVFVARTENADEIQRRYAQVLAARPAAPVRYTLTFESGSAVDLVPEFKTVLDQLLAAIARYPAPEVIVIGHTDRVGSDADNDRLSVRRAETVRDKLVQAGIAASLISVAGRGERQPAIATADGVAQAENRRVEITVR
jgi:OmpA-OmpF porin, OOP family